jgi:hypothetical protein
MNYVRKNVKSSLLNKLIMLNNPDGISVSLPIILIEVFRGFTQLRAKFRVSPFK